MSRESIALAVAERELGEETDRLSVAEVAIESAPALEPVPASTEPVLPTLPEPADAHDVPQRHDREPAPITAVQEPAAEPAIPSKRAEELSEATAGGLAFAILRGQYGLMRAHEPEVEHADDSETLHRLRVDIRRLRAALALFADALPVRAAAHRERLGEIGGMFGAVRDLDIQLEQVTRWTATAPAAERGALELVAEVLDERRRRARRRAIVAFSTKRTRRSLEGFERFLAAGPPRRSSTARTPVVEFAPEVLVHEHRKLLAIGDAIGPESDAEALHALRIRCKRLRYGVEFFEPWYGKAARAYGRRLMALQDLLGTHQDAIVAAATLREIGLDPDRRVGAAELMTIGAQAERCLLRARRARRRLPGPYARVSGRRWRRLLRAAEKARARS
jgi:CHAD domain-containing protein